MLDQARTLYEQSIEHYTNEQDQLGLANVYQSQGDLFLLIQYLRSAQTVYQKALLLYQSERARIGTTYTLAESIRTDYRLGHSDKLKTRFMLALTEARKSGIQSVVEYVMGAAFEAMDKDKERLRAALADLE